MARISKCDKLTEQDRLKLVGRIGEGASWEVLAGEFGIAFTSIREWAIRNGYQRSPVAAKRKLVEDTLASEQTVTQTVTGPSETVTLTGSTGRIEVDAAAQEDVRDMRLGLQAARLALQVSAMGLKGMRDEGIADCKATKTWSECVAINVATIRKIRGLDDAPVNGLITLERSYGKSTA